MKGIRHRRLARRERRIPKRLGNMSWEDREQPVLSAANTQYELTGCGSGDQ